MPEPFAHSGNGLPSLTVNQGQGLTPPAPLPLRELEARGAEGPLPAAEALALEVLAGGLVVNTVSVLAEWAPAKGKLAGLMLPAE